MKIRFYIDEDAMDDDLVDALRSRGVDLETALEAGMIEREDDDPGVRQSSPCRILFVTNIPSPYQVDFFTSLSQRPEVAIRVIFCAASEHDRHFSVPRDLPFPATVLRSRRLPGTPKDWHWNPQFAKTLDQNMPCDVAILSGSYFMPSVWSARRYFVRRRTAWYYWGENPRKKTTAGLRQTVKEAYLRQFLRPAAGAFGIGTLACETFSDLVPPGRPVVNIPYAPNLDPLLSPCPDTLGRARQLRESWPISDPVVVLFVGSLTYRKAPDLLLRAFASAAKDNPRLCLLLAGDGPMAGPLKAETQRLALTDRVRFLGFVEGPALHAAYLSSDLFVLPTRTHEGWGVVVQEALAAGLPVILSDRVGCGRDLVQAGETGYIFRLNDPHALDSLMLKLAGNSPQLRLTGAKSRLLAIRHSCREVAQQLSSWLCKENYLGE